MIAAAQAGAARRGAVHHKATRKLVVFPQTWESIQATSLATNAATIRDRTAQFDYCMVNCSAAIYNTFSSNQSVTLGTLQSQFATFDAADFDDMRFLFFVRSSISDIPKFDTDAHWTNMASNLTAIANFCKDHPLIDGFYYDYEYYGGSPYWFNYPVSGDLSGQSLAQARATVQERSRVLWAAFLAVWPDPILSSTHGPGYSCAGYHTYFGTGGWTITHNDVHTSNELTGAFFTGMMEAVADAGHHAVLHDGGELYGMRTAADVNRARDWAQYVFPETCTDIVLSGMRPKYRASAAQMVYDGNDYTDFSLLPAATIQSMVRHALRYAGGIVPYYTEKHEWVGYTSSGKPTVPTEYLDAMAEGRRLGRL